MALPGDALARPELFAFNVSPWSLQAKWALALAQIPYALTERPADPAGEEALRKRLRLAADARITYPMMVLEDGQQLLDSLDIAKFAARQWPGLFPEGEDVERWALKADAVKNLARAQIAWVLAQEDIVRAIAQDMPGDEPIEAREAMVRGMMGGRISKYSSESQAQDEQAVRATLEEFQERLGDNKFVIAQQLSYADISMALALHMVMPGAKDRRIPTSPALASVAQGPFAQSIVREFPKLIAWADQLIAESFPQELRETA